MGNIFFSDEEIKEFMAAGSGIKDFPNGKYSGKLTRVKLGTFGKDNKRSLLLTYTIESPAEFAQAKYGHFINLDNPKMYWLVKKTIEKFGVDTTDLRPDQIDTVMERTIGKQVDFFLVQTGQYQNCEVETVRDASEETGLDLDVF